MGLCCPNNNTDPSKPNFNVKKEQARTKTLDNQITGYKEKQKQVNKLLLLGAGESGKSTMFKQVMSLYGTGFTPRDRKLYVSPIHGNIVYAMKILVTAVSKNAGSVLASNRDALKALSELKAEESSYNLHDSIRLTQHIKLLWADPAIQHEWKENSGLQLSQTTAYLFDEIDRIVQADYLPNDRDILAVRIRTTGIVQYQFIIQGSDFQIYDVGGQRTERRKWIHLFQDVTALIFVAAISEYDQTVWEDEVTNRVSESLNLFEELVNSPWFHNTNVILFLNKSDLFKEKIVKKPLSTIYEDYKGDSTFENQVDFMRQMFLSRVLPSTSTSTTATGTFPNPTNVPTPKANPTSSTRAIYTHVTCAIDPSNVKFVFDVVSASIIRQSLIKSGLID